MFFQLEISFLVSLLIDFVANHLIINIIRQKQTN